VCLTTDNVYQTFYADYSAQKAFLHSHSYTGNPLACAAANATLDIFRDDDVLNRNRQLAAYMARATAQFADHAHVAEVRQRGMIVAIEMVQDKKTRAPYAWEERRGLAVYRHGLANEALLRPLGNVVYFMPPYVITEAEIDQLAQVAWKGLIAPPAKHARLSVQGAFARQTQESGAWNAPYENGGGERFAPSNLLRTPSPSGRGMG